ncbi:unnamed protein product [Pleuronectes platessa]|uniref:Uncharacterized protein n=1 Tax=Pleuronectes platessa TaxID=8262 RepID=A0A9N7Z8W1_PLEPL|nr:unnamed protein product [Pleuronectes platessa]
MWKLDRGGRGRETRRHRVTEGPLPAGGAHFSASFRIREVITFLTARLLCPVRSAEGRGTPGRAPRASPPVSRL